MNETESVVGLLILGDRELIRRLALEAAEPWRVASRPARRRLRRKADAPECDLCYGDCRPGAFPCAS